MFSFFVVSFLGGGYFPKPRPLVKSYEKLNKYKTMSYLQSPLGWLPLHIDLEAKGPLVGDHLLVNRDDGLHLGILLEVSVEVGE